MKRLFITICFIIITTIVFAQSSIPPITPYNIYKDTSLTNEGFLKAFDSVYSSVLNDPNDTSEGGPKQKLQREREFWEKRLPLKNTKGNIMEHYADVYQKAALHQSQCDIDYEGFRGNWQSIGPLDPNPNYQNQGWVSDIWVDPGDAGFIYAASEGGGLWRSIDEGGSWENITDNILNTGTIGISNMAVNPNNRDEIYIATELYQHFNNPEKYGLGLWHTTDGGVNWNLETGGGLIPSFSNQIKESRLLTVDGIEFAPYLVAGQSYVVITT
jgi:hypothetical protein